MEGDGHRVERQPPGRIDVGDEGVKVALQLTKVTLEQAASASCPAVAQPRDGLVPECAMGECGAATGEFTVEAVVVKGGEEHLAGDERISGVDIAAIEEIAAQCYESLPESSQLGVTHGELLLGCDEPVLRRARVVPHGGVDGIVQCSQRGKPVEVASSVARVHCGGVAFEPAV